MFTDIDFFVDYDGTAIIQETDADFENLESPHHPYRVALQSPVEKFLGHPINWDLEDKTNEAHQIKLVETFMNPKFWEDNSDVAHLREKFDLQTKIPGFEDFVKTNIKKGCTFAIVSKNPRTGIIKGYLKTKFPEIWQQILVENFPTSKAEGKKPHINKIIKKRQKLATQKIEIKRYSILLDNDPNNLDGLHKLKVGTVFVPPYSFFVEQKKREQLIADKQNVLSLTDNAETLVTNEGQEERFYLEEKVKDAIVELKKLEEQTVSISLHSSANVTEDTSPLALSKSKPINVDNALDKTSGELVHKNETSPLEEDSPKKRLVFSRLNPTNPIHTSKRRRLFGRQNTAPELSLEHMEFENIDPNIPATSSLLFFRSLSFSSLSSSATQNDTTIIQPASSTIPVTTKSTQINVEPLSPFTSMPSPPAEEHAAATSEPPISSSTVEPLLFPLFPPPPFTLQFEKKSGN